MKRLQTIQPATQLGKLIVSSLEWLAGETRVFRGTLKISLFEGEIQKNVRGRVGGLVREKTQQAET